MTDSQNPDLKPTRIICIGNGRPGEGCGEVNEGVSGDTCPVCGGMLLDEEAFRFAVELDSLMDSDD